MTVATAAPRPELRARKALLATTFTVALLGLKSLGGVLTVPLCLRYLGPGQTGIWLMLQVIFNYSALAEMGLGQLVMNATGRAYAREDFPEISRVLTASLVLLGVLGLALGAIVCLSVQVLPLGQWLVKGPAEWQRAFSRGLLIVVPLAALRLPSAAVAGLLSGLRDHHWRAGAESVQPALFVALAAAVLLSGGGLETLLWITSLGSVAASYSPLWIAKARHPALALAGVGVSRGLCRRLLAEMLAYSPLPLCLAVQRAAPMFLVSRLLAVAGVTSIYLPVMLFRVTLVTVLDAISKGIQPFIILFDAEGKKEKIEFYWILATETVAGLAAVLIPMTVLAYNPVVSRLFGPQHELGWATLVIFALVFLVEAALTPGVNLALALGQHRPLAAIWTVTAVLTVGLAALGVKQPWFDPYLGLAAGTLLAYALFYAPAHGLLFAGRLRVPRKSYFAAAVGKPLAALGVCAAIAAWGASTSWPPSPLAWPTGLSLVAAAVTLLLLRRASRQWLAARLTCVGARG